MTKISELYSGISQWQDCRHFYVYFYFLEEHRLELTDEHSKITVPRQKRFNTFLAARRYALRFVVAENIVTRL